MKTLPLLTALLIALTFPLTQAHATTAEELAKYLEISTWSTTVALPPASFTVAIYQIKDGVASERLLAGLPAWNKNSGKGITVMLGPENGKSKLVLISGDQGTIMTTIGFSTDQARFSQPLPKKIREGDYILTGTPKDPRDFPAQDPSKYKSALLLRIGKNGQQ